MDHGVTIRLDGEKMTDKRLSVCGNNRTNALES